MSLPKDAEAIIQGLEGSRELPDGLGNNIRKSTTVANINQLIPALYKAGVSGERIAEEIAKAKGMALFPATVAGDFKAINNAIVVDDGDDWLITDSGFLYVINPLDVMALRRQQSANQGKFSQVGVVSKASLTQARANAATLVDLNEEQTGAVRSAEDQYLALVRTAAKQKASDIHFIPTDAEGLVRFRVNGELRDPIEKMPMAKFRLLVNRIQSRCGGTAGSYMEPLKGGDVVEVEKGRVIKLRIQIFPASLMRSIDRQPRAVIRLLSNETEEIMLDQVGIPNWDGNHQLDKIRLLAERIHGLILVSGPTGSGKTSTLSAIQATMLKNNPNRVYYSIEDPVEITLPGITTCEANPKANFDFDKAVEGFMRADPDVILVGEIRNLDVAQQALRASITGHLVMSTIHTNSAIGVITRLVDMGCQRFIIASALMATTAQRLLRRVCPKCSQFVEWKELTSGNHPVLDQPGMETMKLRYLSANERYGDMDFYPAPEHKVRVPSADGCYQCNGTGYQGRVLVHELLSISPSISTMIGDGRSEAEIHAQALREGFKDMAEHAMYHIHQGNTSLDEAAKILDERAVSTQTVAAQRTERPPNEEIRPATREWAVGVGG